MIKEALTRRVSQRLDPIASLLDQIGLSRFYIGGSSLTRRFGDIDLFPNCHFQIPFGELNGGYGIAGKTKNAITLKGGDRLIQICSYHKPTLKELVESFDYAHVQAGAECELQSHDVVLVKDVYFTDAFVNYHVIENSVYIGSEYPLSSLIRLLKYYERGNITKGKAIWSIVKILGDIVQRGFIDYGDFKDQLDAVDLGLVPEELKEIESSELLRLFTLLEKK